MKAENQTRIRIETERILIVVRHHATRGWCDRCRGEVELLQSDRARDVLAIARERQEGLHLGKAKRGDSKQRQIEGHIYPHHALKQRSPVRGAVHKRNADDGPLKPYFSIGRSQTCI